MLTVLQRVRSAHVEVNQRIIGKIDAGLLILCGFEPQDNPQVLEKMLTSLLVSNYLPSQFQ